MSYIGAEPTTAAFPFDQFSGNGTTTAFTLTYAPASATSIMVAISGVVQNPNLYSVIGTTLTFSPAPPTGTNNIAVLYLGLPVIGSSSPGNTAFLSSTDLTATAGQTVFASAGSYTPGFVQVYRNGARLGNADFTATNGTTITLANAATAGDLVTIEYYTLTSLTNALPLTGGTVTGSTTFNTGVNLAAVSGNVGIGTSSPTNYANQKTLAVNGTNYGRLDLMAGGTVYGSLYGGTSGPTLASSGALPVMFETNGTERMRVNAGAPILCLSGGSTTATGTGIAFPATQSASSDANTLDDYEEGTWTPILKGTSTNPSYTTSAASGSYVKIGRMVYVSFIIIVTAVSSQGTGNIYMDALPFTVNDQSYAPTLTVMYNDTWDVDFRAMYASGISWTMRPIGVTQSNATWGGSSALSTGYFSGSGCYLTT
jgi:hypothetical protein